MSISFVYRPKTYQPSTPPFAGAGLHAWIMREVRIAGDVFNLSDSAILDALLPIAVSAGRPIGEARSEIEKTISTVRRTPGNSTTERKPKWPLPDLDLIEAIAAKELEKIGGVNPIDYIRSRSPVKGATADLAVKALFPGDPLICVGSSRSQFITARVSKFKRFDTGQFIVPSPMESVKGYTQAGRLSYKSDSNVGPRRYLVLEFDDLPKETQALVILRLWCNRLVAVVSSGGKSLHAWFYVAGEPEEAIRATMEQAVLRGACHSTFTKSQFVRLPGGLRENGNRQEILYFNPQGVMKT